MNRYKLDIKSIFFVVCYAILSSTLTLTFLKGISYNNVFGFLPSAIYIILLGIIGIVLSIIAFILGFITRNIQIWWRIYLLCFVPSIIIFIANSFPIFSLIGSTGFGYMMPFEALTNLIALISCYYFLYRFLTIDQILEDSRSIRTVILIFFLINISVFLYGAYSNYLSLIQYAN